MATTKKKPTKKAVVKRNEINIRISDIPDKLFKAISENAEAQRRSKGKEVLTFLEQSNYSTKK